MNERIKELALQALKHPDTDIDGLTVFDNDELEKFAELIVRECAEIADKAEPYKASDLIKQHFRVEDRAFKIGSRIKVISGFNVGAKGTIIYIEPTGRMWVLRDGASTDVFYHPEEVIGVEE